MACFEKDGGYPMIKQTHNTDDQMYSKVQGPGGKYRKG